MPADAISAHVSKQLWKDVHKHKTGGIGFQPDR